MREGGGSGGGVEGSSWEGGKGTGGVRISMCKIGGTRKRGKQGIRTASGVLGISLKGLWPAGPHPGGASHC